ncbi:Acetyltransferase involved in cellulose biosynthesis, CelD/BcsL family [Natronoarchaeum philippinense]|uniref:Acetyltransferase involved in cellulose biosynthesis, CelD/BcsL family n=1 Tax=Natronoarchaeum philippinense TaxID=558529 RepID=A0A285P5C5_NATPI|nr:GNAT family N-acetyltransferase [Natronoarchaeum philippinense]SNZ16959.1 Acetyltransferase involved in cellulose biosynthesis, CelD/BcsL family [Natronoarchaeum philippinense]
MSIEIEVFDRNDRDRWNQLVEDSPQGTPFHRYEALEVLADHSDANLHPLVGYKGQEPVGLFPVFGMYKGPVAAAFSPPPDLKVSYLGPALVNFEQLKRRRAERRHSRFVEQCLDVLETELNPKFTLVRASPWYDDPRPFTWSDFDVQLAHTYVVDLSPGRDDLLSQFSSDARRNVTNDPDADVVIREDGAGVIRRIIEQVRERHREQDESFLLSAEMVTELFERLPDGVVRPYACTVDGRFAGGVVVLDDGDTVYRWQGGAKPDTRVAINDRLDWRIITDAIDRGRTEYDLVGANNQRLCGYKAKFAPDLQTYYSIRDGTRSMNFVSGLYKQLR